MAAPTTSPYVLFSIQIHTTWAYVGGGTVSVPQGDPTGASATRPVDRVTGLGVLGRERAGGPVEDGGAGAAVEDGADGGAPEDGADGGAPEDGGALVDGASLPGARTTVDGRSTGPEQLAARATTRPAPASSRQRRFIRPTIWVQR